MAMTSTEQSPSLAFIKMTPDADTQRVADLIYHTDDAYFRLLYGPQSQGINRIVRLLVTPGHALNCEHIYLATQGETILGVLWGYSATQQASFSVTEQVAVVQAVGRLTSLRRWLLGPVLARLLTTDVPLNTFYITALSIDSHHRGRGVGSFLIQKIVCHAQSLGCSSLLLEVAEDNNSARAFYALHGFQQVRRNTLKLPWRTINTYTLERPLKIDIALQAVQRNTPEAKQQGADETL